MKTNYKLTLAVLAGILLGIAGAKALQAQQQSVPPGYVISEADATRCSSSAVLPIPGSPLRTSD